MWGSTVHRLAIVDDEARRHTMITVERFDEIFKAIRMFPAILRRQACLSMNLSAARTSVVGLTLGEREVHADAQRGCIVWARNGRVVQCPDGAADQSVVVQCINTHTGVG